MSEMCNAGATTPGPELILLNKLRECMEKYGNTDWDYEGIRLIEDYRAAALAQARREGRREGITAMRDNLLSDDDDAVVRGWINGSAARLLEAEK